MTDTVKQVRSFPPNYPDIVKRFPGAKGRSGIVFTFGPCVYAPFSRSLPADVWHHEMVHVRQQGNHPAQWWSDYLGDRRFRLEQELEAYRAQIAYAEEHYGLKFAKRIRAESVRNLSSSVYGNMVSRAEAVSLLA